MIIVILSVLFVLGLLALSYHLALFALFWAPAIALGLVSMQGAQTLAVEDPFAPFWAFVGGAMIGRLLMGRLRARMLHGSWL